MQSSKTQSNRETGRYKGWTQLDLKSILVILSQKTTWSQLIPQLRCANKETTWAKKLKSGKLNERIGHNNTATTGNAKADRKPSTKSRTSPCLARQIFARWKRGPGGSRCSEGTRRGPWCGGPACTGRLSAGARCAEILRNWRKSQGINTENKKISNCLDFIKIKNFRHWKFELELLRE